MKRLLAVAAVLGSLCAFVTMPRAASPIVWINKSNLAGTTHVRVDQMTHTHVGLVSFSLKFNDGDHKVRGIGVMPEKESVASAFQDNDGNDRYALDAKFLKLPWPNGRVVKNANCKGTCSLPIRNPYHGGGGQFVLSGFHVKRKSGESNIRQLAVRLSPDRKSVQVTFRDNGTFPFAAEVAYTFVPSLAAFGTKTVRRAKRQNNVSIALSKKGKPILQGFDLRFENGDHHLRELSIDAEPGRVTVRFNDNNYDDPYRATIDWGIMK